MFEYCVSFIVRITCVFSTNLRFLPRYNTTQPPSSHPSKQHFAIPRNWSEAQTSIVSVTTMRFHKIRSYFSSCTQSSWSFELQALHLIRVWIETSPTPSSTRTTPSGRRILFPRAPSRSNQILKRRFQPPLDLAITHNQHILLVSTD
jgi:hypothetical protein